jgi:alanine racemase
MARQGAQPGRALEAVLQSLTQSPNIVVDGVMTHFAAAEVSGSSLTALQQRRFETALDQIRTAGIRPAWVHAGNSSSVEEASVLPWLLDIAKRVGARPMIRTGLGLYGYLLPLEGMSSHLPSRLEPVMTWKTEVIDLREIEAGDTVGYSATFVAPRPMRLALLPVGYADGLRRELSSTPQEPGGWVVIGGHRAPIIGRISMNLTVVDISDLSEVQLGDEVVLLGPGMTAEDHGALAGTIPYEILCCVRGQQVLVP